MRGQRYPRETVQKVTKLYAIGNSPRSIEESTGIPYPTILYWLKQAGVYKGGYSADRNERIRIGNMKRDARLAELSVQPTSRQCPKCCRELPLKDFYKVGSRLSDIYKEKGLYRTSTYCKSCTLVINKIGAGRTNRNQKDVVIRAAMWSAYGGACDCCGETRREFLCIDHIYGGGSKERRATHKGGIVFYRHLAKLGFPKDKYRILCHNCNQSMGVHGYCPHALDALATVGMAVESALKENRSLPTLPNRPDGIGKDEWV